MRQEVKNNIFVSSGSQNRSPAQQAWLGREEQGSTDAKAPTGFAGRGFCTERALLKGAPEKHCFSESVPAGKIDMSKNCMRECVFCSLRYTYETSLP